MKGGKKKIIEVSGKGGDGNRKCLFKFALKMTFERVPTTYIREQHVPEA